MFLVNMALEQTSIGTLFYLDLSNPKTFRDLSKPIGALNEKRLSCFKVLLHVSCVLVVVIINKNHANTSIPKE